MKVLIPTTITPAMIGAGSTIPAVDTAAGEVAWVASGAYAIDDVRADAGGLYSCVKAYTATGASKPPSQDAVNWLYMRPTNRMSPFDEYLYTKASKPGTLTYVLSPGFITGFAMHGLEADAYSFEYRDAPGGAVLVASSGDLWEQAQGLWEYLFGNLQRTTKWASPDLPLRPTGEITVTITRNEPTTPAAVGWIGVGQWRLLAAPGRSTGGTEYGIEVTPKSYAYFKRNDDGTYKRLPGRSAKQVSGTAIVAAADAPMVEDLLRRVLDEPVAVDFSDLPRYSHLSTVGFLTGSVTADSFAIARLSFKIEGNI